MLELHRTHRVGWLRAVVLGANDGVVSVASLILGVVAAQANRESVLLTGVAGLVAGAMSMAAGEYVSVSSQADTEKADRAREKKEILEDPVGEHEELALIYVNRGLDQKLAEQVAEQLMKKDALATHVREELGLSETLMARPLQAAWASAGAFSVGAAFPLVMAFSAPETFRFAFIFLGSLAFLICLGWLAARAGGAEVLTSVLRVSFWGILAMGLTAGIGKILGVSV